MTELTEQGKKNLQGFGQLIGSIMAYNWYLDPHRRYLDKHIDPEQEELKKNYES